MSVQNTVPPIAGNILAFTYCPTCHIGWGFHPPAKIDGSDAYRCIECKAVYTGAMMQADDNKADALRLHKEKMDYYEQIHAAREFVKRHPALTLIDLAEFEAFLKMGFALDAATPQVLAKIGGSGA